jgi:hypothetical protein
VWGCGYNEEERGECSIPFAFGIYAGLQKDLPSLSYPTIHPSILECKRDEYRKDEAKGKE